MTERHANLRLAPQLDRFDSTHRLMSMRTSREKVAILLAALSKETAVSLLQKFDPDSIKQLLESSGHLGDLNTGDFDPVVREFTDEFAEALGISAGSEQLIPLLEAAFSREKVSQLLGIQAGPVKDSVWSKFTPNMDSLLVPFLLDENEQTSAVILSKLPLELAAKCFALLPRELTPRILGRSLALREIPTEVLELVERSIEEHFFAKSLEASGSKWVERVASVVNRMDREQALSVLDSLSKSMPEEALKLRKLIFMFEDLDRIESKSMSRLFDRVDAELVTPALWGMPASFKETVLTCLSARARRMVESELGSDDGTPRANSVPARKKIAETALLMARKGEITLPEAA
jgi:flagellar motor switch protein FliG